jgi:DNA-binding NtrC family response regulator
LCGWLEQAGNAVTCSQPARTLLTALASNPPGLLVVGLPRGNGQGFDFYRRLNSHRQLRHLPVIVVSDDPDLEYELLEAYDFQARPFNRTRLLGAVAQMASSEPAKLVGHFPVQPLEPFQELLRGRPGVATGRDRGCHPAAV